MTHFIGVALNPASFFSSFGGGGGGGGGMGKKESLVFNKCISFDEYNLMLLFSGKNCTCANSGYLAM